MQRAVISLLQPSSYQVPGRGLISHAVPDAFEVSWYHRVNLPLLLLIVSAITQRRRNEALLRMQHTLGRDIGVVRSLESRMRSETTGVAVLGSSCSGKETML